jgi:hypothetical protein
VAITTYPRNGASASSTSSTESPGTTSLQRLDENLEAASLELTPVVGTRCPEKLERMTGL